MRARKVVGPVGEMISAKMGLAEAEVLAAAITNDPSSSVQAIRAALVAAIAGPVEPVKHRPAKV